LKRGAAAAARLLGYEFYRLPLGRSLSLRRRVDLTDDPLAAMRTILRRPLTCVFDIGAHVGETALRFTERFPHAVIYSFEPDPSNFAKLVANTGALPNVIPVQNAVTEAVGFSTLYRNRYSETHSLLRPSTGATRFVVSPELLEPDTPIAVPTVTIDEFCARRGVDEIDVLKIDAQGLELPILRGGASLLARRPGPLIYLEVNFVESYEGQDLFPTVYQYLYDRGFRLVWLYDTGFSTHYYQLSCNALFVEEGAGRRQVP